MRNLLPMALCLLCLGCGRVDQQTDRPASPATGDTAYVPPESIDRGPELRGTLSAEQDSLIEYLWQTFQEVDPTPLEEWKREFRRDAQVDEELGIWMSMAEAYRAYTDGQEVAFELKREAYELILMRSLSPTEEVLKAKKLQFHTEEQAREIMAAYPLKADPIQVIEESN